MSIAAYNIFICFFLTDNLDATEIPEHSDVQRVASLLGVGKQPLIDALTRKTIFASGESVVSISAPTFINNFYISAISECRKYVIRCLYKLLSIFNYKIAYAIILNYVYNYEFVE